MIIELVDSGSICGTVTDVFHCFWRAELWPRLTSHVTTVEMLQEQDGYQRYAMRVHVDGKDYVLETQRIAVAPRSISFQQPKPPVFMNSHAGLWSFEEGSSGTRVSVTHRIDVNDQKAIEALGAKSVEDARQKILGNLHKNGMAMIEAVNKFLQSQEGCNLQEARMAN